MKGIIIVLLAVCASLQLKAQSHDQLQALKLDTTKLGAINLNHLRITEPIGLTSLSDTQPNFKSPVDFYSTMPVVKLQSADKKMVAPLTIEGFNMPVKQIRINPDNTKVKVTP